MWASLPEKAAGAGGSICCSYAARIFRILGMPLSHLFILSLCFASVRFQMNICRSAQRAIWQHTCHAFSLPACLQTENWAAAVLLSGKTKSHGIIFPIVFRGRCVFSLVLLHQYLSPMHLTNVVPWLSWPCYNLSFLSLLALCHLHLSLLHLDMILSSRTCEAPSTISCKDGSGSREGRP